MGTVEAKIIDLPRIKAHRDVQTALNAFIADMTEDNWQLLKAAIQRRHAVLGW